MEICLICFEIEPTKHTQAQSAGLNVSEHCYTSSKKDVEASNFSKYYIRHHLTLVRYSAQAFSLILAGMGWIAVVKLIG